MPIYRVVRKSDGQQVYEYQADAPIEWNGMEFAAHHHVEVVPDPEPMPQVNAADWYIYVGAFFDRFGAFKIPILASADPVVQALIKDATVRKYIDLVGRRGELLQMISILQAKGFAVDQVAILDVQPDAQELYRGN